MSYEIEGTTVLIAFLLLIANNICMMIGLCIAGRREEQTLKATQPSSNALVQ